VRGSIESLGVTDSVEVLTPTTTTATTVEETQNVGVVEPRSTKRSRSIEEEDESDVESPELVTPKGTVSKPMKDM